MARNAANLTRVRWAMGLGLLALSGLVVAALARREPRELPPAATALGHHFDANLTKEQRRSEDDSAAVAASAAYSGAAAAVRTERARALQEQWNREAEDAEWTAAAREGIMDALGDDLPGDDIVRAVDCRATLCRIELVFETHESVMKLGPLIAASSGSIEAHSLPNDDTVDAGAVALRERPQYLVYAARPGVRVADLASVK